jgi:hypothetical protein
MSTPTFAPATETPSPELAPSLAPATPSRPHPAGLLIVRQFDQAMTSAVTEFLSKLGVGLHVIDPSTAQPRRPLMDAIHQHHRAAFAIVLNDVSIADGEALFDLGCCVGAFGAARLCVLHRDGAPTTDDRGIRHIPLDPGCGWQLLLARHLKAGGVGIDLNQLI